MLVRLNRSNLLHKYILYLSNYERKDYSLTVIIGVIRGMVPELGISLVRTIAKLSYCKTVIFLYFYIMKGRMYKIANLYYPIL